MRRAVDLALGKEARLVAEVRPERAQRDGPDATQRCVRVPAVDLDVDLVIESTGFFTKRDGAQKHLDAGAKRFPRMAVAYVGPDHWERGLLALFEVAFHVSEKDHPAVPLARVGEVLEELGAKEERREERLARAEQEDDDDSAAAGPIAIAVDVDEAPVTEANAS